jgi:hypothetical protein
MTIDVTDLLTLARQLAEGDSECEWRAGASRAYYAVYHRALQVAEKHLPRRFNSNGGVHLQLEQRLRGHSRNGRMLASSLRDFKKVRTHATTG